VLTILKTTRTVALSCAPNPTNYGSSHTTCTATVSAGGGSVNFTYNGGTPWGTVGIGGGTASIAGFDGAAAATYPVLATASGDPNYVDGASGSTNYIVNKSATSMTGVIAPNPITFGQSFTVSGHVDCNSDVAACNISLMAVLGESTHWTGPATMLLDTGRLRLAST
jgi:hypothetical protein